jgi:5-methyltetrahydrofolate--homocysteine methyltransferase
MTQKLVEEVRGCEHMRTVLKGTAAEVLVSDQDRLVVIGERINPSGRARLAASLARGDMSLVRTEALAQAQAGAHVVDVNVSAADVDEKRILPLAVQTVAEVVDAPICIDTADPEALQAALSVCPGRPLVNSVTGEEASLEAVLPLVKDRGCAVIGLCMDERGIPASARKRMEIAEKIIERAESHGIATEDVIIDPLAMAVGADDTAGVTTVQAIRLISTNLRANITFGGSNISFGLPERSLLNRSFLAMAMWAGLTCVILDPLDVEVRKTIAACDLLLGKDEYAARFLADSRAGWRLPP